MPVGLGAFTKDSESIHSQAPQQHDDDTAAEFSLFNDRQIVIRLFIVYP
jgi:hypothetical protein